MGKTALLIDVASLHSFADVASAALRILAYFIQGDAEVQWSFHVFDSRELSAARVVKESFPSMSKDSLERLVEALENFRKEKKRVDEEVVSWSTIFGSWAFRLKEETNAFNGIVTSLKKYNSLFFFAAFPGQSYFSKEVGSKTGSRKASKDQNQAGISGVFTEKLQSDLRRSSVHFAWIDTGGDTFQRERHHCVAAKPSFESELLKALAPFKGSYFHVSFLTSRKLQIQRIHVLITRSTALATCNPCG